MTKRTPDKTGRCKQCRQTFVLTTMQKRKVALGITKELYCCLDCFRVTHPLSTRSNSSTADSSSIAKSTSSL